MAIITEIPDTNEQNDTLLPKKYRDLSVQHLSSKDSNGNTPLIKIIKSGNVELFKDFLKYYKIPLSTKPEKLEKDLSNGYS